MYNRHYAKRRPDGTFEFAPAVLPAPDGRGVITNPLRGQYLAAGWRLYSPHGRPPTSHRAGWHYEQDDWSETKVAYVPKWKLVRDARQTPPPPRVFVTADLVEALMAEGVWEQARAWIVEQGMLDLVLATKEFDEDNANFAAGRAALQAALGWTDAEVEELLAKCECVKEGY